MTCCCWAWHVAQGWPSAGPLAASAAVSSQMEEFTGFLRYEFAPPNCRQPGRPAQAGMAPLTCSPQRSSMGDPTAPAYYCRFDCRAPFSYFACCVSVVESASFSDFLDQPALTGGWEQQK